MFDNPGRYQPKDNNEKGDRGINLLPKEMQKTAERADYLGYNTERKDKIKIDPKALHLPPKEQFKKVEESLPKKIASKSGKITASRPAIWHKLVSLFHSAGKKESSPAILAVNAVVPPLPKINLAEQPKAVAKNNIIPKENFVESASRPKPIIPAKEKNPLFETREPSAEAVNDNLEVNLLPQIKKRFTDHQIILSYGFILLIGLLILFSPYIFYRSKNKSYRADNEFVSRQLELIDAKTKDMQTQIKDYGALAWQLASLSDVLKNHVYWSRFFPILENHTVGNVYFTSLEVTEKSKITVAGLALDLRSAAEELVVMKSSQTYFNIKLESLSFVEPKNQGDPTVSFSLSFEIPQSLIAAVEQ